MEDDKIVTPVEETQKDDATITTEVEKAEKVENAAEEVVREDVEDEMSDKVEDDDRIEALEDSVKELNERFDEFSTEQEKIVSVLDKISDKVMSTEIPSADQVEASKKNSVAEAEVEEESNETEPESNEVEPETNAVETEEKSEETTETSEEEKLEEEEVEEKEEQEEQKPEEETAPEQEPAEEEEAEDKKESKNKMSKEELQEILNSFKADVVNQILDANVKAPEAEEVESTEEETKQGDVEIAKNWRDRYNDQVAAAWDFHRLNNIEAGKKLQAINQFNADERVKNDAGTAPITITSLADFVLPPEMDREIHGLRTNYVPFLNELNYTQTNSLQFMWATRVGDINMQNVKFCADGKDGNLKPVETYGLERGIAQMEEMAAVTPICDNATKYMAVDILADVARGYRNDYDRKLAELALARMQEALNTTGNTVEYDPETAVDGLVDFVKATTLVSDQIVAGKFVFNARTKALILENLLRSGNGDLGSKAFTTGDTQTIWGYDYVVVPNDLMPTLGTNEVKQVKVMNNQTGVVETVDITSPVFYGDLNEFVGKVSGGLNYTVSTDAAYEINGVVYSAFQRDELVLRGHFYRGGYIPNPEVFSGLVPASA